MNVANCSNDDVCIHTYVVEWTLIIFNRIVYSCVCILSMYVTTTVCIKAVPYKKREWPLQSCHYIQCTIYVIIFAPLRINSIAKRRLQLKLKNSRVGQRAPKLGWRLLEMYAKLYATEMSKPL